MVIVVALLLLAGVLWLHSFHDATTDVTDPARYQQILAQLRVNGNVRNPGIELAHFPPAIPPIAANVRFFYRPHFLQGGPILQLRLTLPAAQVNQIAVATTATTQPVTPPTAGAMTNFCNINSGSDLPPDFQIYILGSKMQPNGPEWDYVYGVAISRQRNEVIYWLAE